MIEETLLLAGGCFWCIEAAFMGIEGVVSVQSGYTGGQSEHPTYEAVCRGDTGHFEAVEVTFDPDKITFLQVLEIFWRHIDPFDSNGQFHDRGPQYQTAIFVSDARSKRLAEDSKRFVEVLFNQTVATVILDTAPFFVAEEKHQNYCKKEPAHFARYQASHQERLHTLWDDKPPLTTDDLKEYLTPLQYKVTQEEGTEPPFKNAYFDNKQEGVYVDVISGVPLFSSDQKYDSKTGWPSFTEPLDPHEIIEIDDYSLGSHRIEVRSRSSNAHLGHRFPDGPTPTGQRYCLNSAALRFIPKNMY